MTMSSRRTLVPAMGSTPSNGPCSPITAFHRPRAFEQEDFEPEPLTLPEVLDWSDEKLERRRTYIQRLFPLPERPRHEHDEDLLTADERQAYLDIAVLRYNLQVGLAKMLPFFGFAMSPPLPHAVSPTDADILRLYSIARLPEPLFSARANSTWRQVANHNQRRLTRMIRCLRLLGLRPLAADLHRLLREGDAGIVNQETWGYWDRAMNRELYLPPAAGDEQDGVIWLWGASDLDVGNGPQVGLPVAASNANGRSNANGGSNGNAGANGHAGSSGEETQSEPSDEQMRSEPSDEQTQSEPSDEQTQSEPSDEQMQSEPSDEQMQSEPSDEQTRSEPSDEQTQSEPSDEQMQSEGSAHGQSGPSDEEMQSEPSDDVVESIENSG